MSSTKSADVKCTECRDFFFIFTGVGASLKAVVLVMGAHSLTSYQLLSGSRVNSGLSLGIQETSGAIGGIVPDCWTGNMRWKRRVSPPVHGDVESDRVSQWDGMGTDKH